MGNKIILIMIIISIFAFYPVDASAQGVDIDFIDADLFSVLEILSNQASLSFVAGEAIRKNFGNKLVTLHLTNTTYQDALIKVIYSNGLDYEIDGKIIIISTPPAGMVAPTFKKDTEVIYLMHLEGAKIVPLVKEMFPEVKCKEGILSNEIVVEGRPSEIRKITNFIAQIDMPIPQVVIESKVVEVSEAGLLNLGLRFGSSSGSLSYVLEQDADSFERGEAFAIGLMALQSKGEADILATPKVVTLDGHPAEIQIGNKVPYAVPAQSGSSSIYWRVEYIDAGVKLKITPIVLDAGYILVEIAPEVSNVSEWRTTAAGEFPVISSRNVKTKVRVKDGETIVIGGLISKNDRETISKIPFLGDIPLIGWIFHNKRIQDEKSEIIFMITPRLLRGEEH
ncbi:MAG: hypothetical protein KKB81_07115 [Candidatus Margulisbacteria bacterium]|nr:hypothetical protein [Candidatus Margulisiibacteriota bacterium]MBU1021913.1 hypothetical protein [Candidatus Margulisiibacteriota bacterium]MBU1728551.1 hypothetical protein [Candidatus Margulisiibacteriota bacterium]MBU1954698.1 hypothetical protein [Candidatus Margulisiibacteriota bacterium]